MATDVTVESAQAEIVNTTPYSSNVGVVEMRSTGDYSSSGRVAVEAFGADDPNALIGKMGLLSFGSLSRRAICESAVVEGRVNDLLRMRFSFVPTDATPES